MSFQQGLSGLNASAKQLDVIGNNVANANTVGFKGSQAYFADVFAGSLSGGGGGAQIGIGTTLSSVTPLFGQGNINVSSNPLDVAINGNGFFRLSQNGTVSYSRNGQFQLDKSGYLVTANGANLTGYPAASNGQIIAVQPTNLQVSTSDIAPAASSAAAIVLNLDSRDSALSAAAFSPANATSYNSATSLSLFDSQGNSHILTSYFVKTANNAWSVFATLDGNQVGAGAVGALNFLPSGAIDTATTTLPMALSMPVTTGATTPLALTLDFTGSTQYGGAFGVTQLTQDGYASGKLTGFTISTDGIVVGRYSNGQTRSQGQIVLANFTNPQGMQPLGNSAWSETSASGQALVGAPGTGSLGSLQSGALEESNIDLTAELVAMITAQRVYQANAQTIKTMDQTQQTIVNLR